MIASLHKRPTFNIQLSTSNLESEFDVGSWAFGVFLCSEFCPNRCMIGGFFSFPRIAIDSCRSAFSRQGFARQNHVDTQSAIFRKRKHPIIPPGKKAAFLVMQSQRVPETGLAELAECFSFAIRTHDRFAP